LQQFKTLQEQKNFEEKVQRIRAKKGFNDLQKLGPRIEFFVSKN
jgi:hypothetical protein